jgi:hypothetical protein
MVALVMALRVACGQESRPSGSSVIVHGLSLHAMENEQSFPVLVRDSVNAPFSQYLTIQFDVLASEPPSIKIRFWHCTRDWLPDNNVFLQDETHNTSFHLDYRTSPNGVRWYSYRYENRFPDKDGIIRFAHSGNWIFRILSADERTVYGEGRFFVVDNLVPADIRVSDDYLTDNASPLNQVHRVEVHIILPGEVEGQFYTTVDVYQNRRLAHPYRIDAYDRNPYTFVEGYNTGRRRFSVSNIFPGNEYRVLDLGNVTRYPNHMPVRLVSGADQARNFWRTGSDRNGTALLDRFTGNNSDYLDVLFRLDLTATTLRNATVGGREIFVVGQFNQWQPTLEDRLIHDNNENSHIVRKLLRRGLYDYQYITGLWDPGSRSVLVQDWLILEGNDWRTTNVYRAFVYYKDPRFGGFDRIVGYGTTRRARPAQGSY